MADKSAHGMGVVCNAGNVGNAGNAGGNTNAGSTGDTGIGGSADQGANQGRCWVRIPTGCDKGQVLTQTRDPKKFFIDDFADAGIRRGYIFKHAGQCAAGRIKDVPASSRSRCAAGCRALPLCGYMAWDGVARKCLCYTKASTRHYRQRREDNNTGA